MKYDLTKKPSKNAKRTLEAFSGTLEKLLETTALEDISIGKLCETCDYPRATFYNYFDDIYDLLRYCFTRMLGEMQLEKYQEIPVGKRTETTFTILYDYFNQREEMIRQVVKNNPLDGILMQELKRFTTEQIRVILETCTASFEFPVEKSIIVEHYCNTIGLLLVRSFYLEPRMKKEEALQTLEFLVGHLERYGSAHLQEA